MLDIQKDFLLAPFTTFKIGGPAKEFVVVTSAQELIEALKYAQDNNLKFFVLGGGSNILFNDKGFDGLVIKLKLNGIKTDENTIDVEAGVLLSRVVNYSVENGLSGIEWAIGVPGTVGGATAINAGCFGGEMSDVVERVKFLNATDYKIETY
jgi:UDP-N-acetylmuramate dehydrogenase